MMQLDLDVERAAEGQVARAALELVVLGLAELVAPKCSSMALPVKSGWGDLVEQVAQAILHEPVVRAALKLDQVRDRQDLGDPRVRWRSGGGGPTIDFSGSWGTPGLAARRSRHGNHDLGKGRWKRGAALTDRVWYRG